jgi:ribosomal protein S7
MKKNIKQQYHTTATRIAKTPVTNFTIYNESFMELRKKLTNHVTRNGHKHKSEKAINKSFKAIQKSQKKNHGKITKLSVVNAVPTFKIIKLTNKKRRKKSLREIPTLVSSYKSRVSLGLKYLIKATTGTQQAKQLTFFEKFKNELLSGASSDNNAILTKNSFQAKALDEKKYFRFFRW